MIRLITSVFRNTINNSLIQNGTKIFVVAKRNVSKESSTRHGFHEESEKMINEQINREFSVGYTYLSMASFFNQDTVALPGFHAMFAKSAKEELDHGMELVRYQNIRGGRLKLSVIEPPKEEDWEPCSAVTAAIKSEKEILDSLINLAKTASRHGDSNLEDFIVTHYLGEQYDALKKLGDLLTQIKRVGDNFGIYVLDRKILKTFQKD